MLRRLAAAAFLAAAAACSAPPDKELHQAEGAIAAAKAADAARYAPAELAAAEAALHDYRAAVDTRDFRQALRLAMDAQANASEAARRAGDEKALARSRAERLIADLASLIDRMTVRPGATVRVTPAVAKQRPAAVMRLQEARSRLEKQEYREVVASLGPVVEQLRRDLAEGASPPVRRAR
jgi:hypothetical protein